LFTLQEDIRKELTMPLLFWYKPFQSSTGSEGKCSSQGPSKKQVQLPNENWANTISPKARLVRFITINIQLWEWARILSSCQGCTRTRSGPHSL